MNTGTGIKVLTATVVIWLTMVFGFIFPLAADAASMPSFDNLPPIPVDNQTSKLDLTHIAVTTDGLVYVTESLRNAIAVMTFDGVSKGVITGITAPQGIAVNSNDIIFVTSSTDKSVVMVNRQKVKIGSLGQGVNEFLRPVYLDIDPSNDDVYVTDQNAGAIKVYNSSGSLLRSIPDTGNLPIAAAVYHDEVFVLDQPLVSGFRTARIIVFNKNTGAVVRAFGEYGTGSGQLKFPKSIAIDTGGRVFIVDNYHRVVYCFDGPQGIYLGAISDNANNALASPIGVAISKNGKLFAASTNENKLRVFGLDNYTVLGTTPDAFTFSLTNGVSDPASGTISLANTGKGALSYIINTTTGDGAEWIQLSGASGSMAGVNGTATQTVTMNGAALQVGVYTGTITVQDVDSSTVPPAVRFEKQIPVSLTVSKAAYLSAVQGESNGSVISIRLVFSSDTDMASAQGSICLDADQNAATGAVNPGDFSGSNLGCEYVLDFTDLSNGINVYSINSNLVETLVGTVPVALSGHTADFEVPLSMLGNDNGMMNFAVAVGIGGTTTDLAPNTGFYTVAYTVVPAAPVLAGPSGSGAGTLPSYTWNAVAGAADYRIYIEYNGTSSSVTYTAVQAHCAGGTGQCYITETNPYEIGTSVSWNVRAINPVGTGPWGTSMTFQVGSIPVAPTLVGPSGVSGILPTYTWNAVSGATDYRIYLAYNGTSSSVSYTAAQANCPTGSGQCTFTETNPYAIGTSVSWLVRAINQVGSGPWGTSMTFQVASIPAAPTLVGPTGSGASALPTYTWNAVSGATDYRLYLEYNGTSSSATYTAAQAHCTGGTGQCYVTETNPYVLGTSVSWNVRAVNQVGSGPWGVSMTFQVGSVPVAPTLVGPSGSGAGSLPTYTWNAVPGATDYRIYIAYSGTSKTIIYTAAEASCASGIGECSVTETVPFATGIKVSWNVRAMNQVGTGPWGVSKTFTVTLP